MTTPITPSEKALFIHFARIGKALANPIRLELLELLGQAPRSVERLAELLAESVAATSHHLQALRAANLVEGRKQGLFVTYRLADELVGTLWELVQALANRQLVELREQAANAAGGSDPVENIDVTTLTARLRRGEVTLIDVRPREEYAAAHIPGALSAPLEDLEDMLSALPPDGDIVAYGRGPLSALPAAAVALLRRHQRSALRLAEGIAQWRAAGLPVLAGAPGP